MSGSESSSLLLSGAQGCALAPGSRTTTVSKAHVVRQGTITSGMTIECASYALDSDAEFSLTYTIANYSHDIWVGDGLLHVLDKLLVEKGITGPLKIIMDSAISNTLAPLFQQVLSHRHFTLHSLVSSEEQKTWDTIDKLTQHLLAEGIDRQTTLIAVGGGIIGDCVGFAASILLRGLRWVYIPTTLLAQVDAALGGKTAINTPLGKNLLGRFHFPELALCDTQTLRTLPQRQWQAGYAEIVKHALITDAPFFAWLQEHTLSLQEPDTLVQAIKQNLLLKQTIIDGDWFEEKADGRQLLNLGHTFAHAFETMTGYRDLLHGEAVSLGLAAAFDMAAFLHLIPPHLAETIKQHLNLRHLPIDYAPYLKQPHFLEILQRDKKNQDNDIVFILPCALGDVKPYRDVEGAVIQQFIGSLHAYKSSQS